MKTSSTSGRSSRSTLIGTKSWFMRDAICSFSNDSRSMTCHWCHVMERESFENEQIASLMNQDFVPIKVDREERPDVDDVFMAAVQTMTGSGGWPLSVFLTPERKP